MTDIQISDVTIDHLPGLTELARAVLDHPQSEAYFRWKYFNNPGKRNFGQCASDEKTVVGHHGSIPVAIQIEEHTYLGAQLVDAMVIRELRRAGVFTKMAVQTFEKMDCAGVHIAFVFPALITLKALTEKLEGWTHIANVPRFVCVIDPAKVTSLVSKPRQRMLYTLWLRTVGFAVGFRRGDASTTDVTIEEVMEFDERFDRLWKKANRSFGLAVARTSSYLKWRYSDHPEKHYRCLAAVRGGNLDAYVVLCRVPTQDVGTWELVELIVDPEHVEAGLALLRAIRNWAKRAGIAQLTTWMLQHHTPYIETLHKAGFIHAKSRFVPGRFGYTVPLVVRSPKAENLPVSPLAAANWFVSMGDSDLH